MATVIWIRHGTVDYESDAADDLTPSGEKLRDRLPSLLAEEDIAPVAVFYDASKKRPDGCAISRCKRTVDGISPTGVSCNPCNDSDRDRFLQVCSQPGVIVFCYTSERLKHFPPIKNSCVELYMGDTSVSNPPCAVSSWLYENIMVTEWAGEAFRLLRTINTNDRKST